MPSKKKKRIFILKNDQGPSLISKKALCRGELDTKLLGNP
jgi:hypothetical protein